MTVPLRIFRVDRGNLNVSLNPFSSLVFSSIYFSFIGFELTNDISDHEVFNIESNRSVRGSSV